MSIEQKLPTELPTLYEGVFNDVFYDLLADRALFTKETMASLNNHNRPLLESVMSYCMISPNRDLSLDYALAYYAMYDRSAEKSGNIMVQVTQALIDSQSEFRAREMEIAQDGKEEGVNEYFLKEEAQRKKRVLKEKQSSPEARVFWDRVLLHIAHNLTITGSKTSAEIVEIFEPLYEINYLLNAQVDANRTRKIADAD